MNELKIFENAEFGRIRAVDRDGEPWFVAADVCRALELGNSRQALTRLDDDEKGVISADTPGGKQEMNVVNEPGLYSLVLGSRKPEAKAFKRWITHDVIPSIRKTGAYNFPKDYPSALRALADSEEKRMALEAENAIQKQAIADFQPMKQYVDTILESRATMTTTQIAADYDMSARQLNKILHDAGLQHKVNGQWILYKNHMGNGYTKSKTFRITRSDGTHDTVPNTEWSQKGRLKIHNILSARGILANMDKTHK